MKFSEMKYVRPDMEQMGTEIKELTHRLTDACDYECALTVFKEAQELFDRLETAAALAYVRHTIDTLDEFYDSENTFFDEELPKLQPLVQEFSLALYHSEFRGDFEKQFGSLYFTNIELALKCFKPEIVPMMQEENRLVSDYAKLIASAQIEFEGEKRTLSQLTPFKQSPDDILRRAAWRAEGEWYSAHSQELDKLYDELVKVRDETGKKLGGTDFIETGYCRMQRNCYDASDVARFADAVEKYIVPIADRLMKAQAKRTGLEYPLDFADAALSFRDGNAKPQGTGSDILEHGRRMYREMSPRTAEFIDFMFENELFDVESRTGKAAGGYCITLGAYRAPFIFANFNGTSGDVEVMTHEAGHAFAAYASRDVFPVEYRSPSYESCEIHSMSMEFFAWDWAEGFFGKDTDKFKYSHLASALTFIPYGTMVDRFQHEMYAHPEYTPQRRHEVWRELLGRFMPWMKLGVTPFYGEGKGWQRQTHIYERPFYYIDYCLAQTAALSFWALMREDREDAWNRYLALIDKSGTLDFNGLVSAAGLETPFGDDALRKIAGAAVKWLESHSV